MIDKEFENIIKKLANERGKEIFLEPKKFKPLLLDYTKNEFRKESSLLITMLEAGCVNYINEAKNFAECKKNLVKRLEDEENLSSSKSAEMLDMLTLVSKIKVEKA